MELIPKLARIFIDLENDTNIKVELEGPDMDPIHYDLSPKQAERLRLVASEKVQSKVFADQFNTAKLTDNLVNLGKMLFQILDSEKLRGFFEMALSQLVEGQYLWLQFRIRHSDLDSVPYELLYNDIFAADNKEFVSQAPPPVVALSSRILATRYHEQERVIPKVQETDSLRVLFVWASPQDKEPITDIAERESFARLLSPATYQITLLPHATKSSLQKAIQDTDKPFHIIQYYGHGSEAGLFFENKEGVSDLISAKDLLELLCQEHDQGVFPQIVVLTACKSSGRLLSLCRALVEDGVPAVVGMRTEISQIAATIFSEIFYACLRDGISAQWAAQEARRQMYQWISERPDWYAPVFYLRVKDGQLFEYVTHTGESQKLLYLLNRIRNLTDSKGAEARQLAGELLDLGVSAIGLLAVTISASTLKSVRLFAIQILDKIIKEGKARPQVDTRSPNGKLQPGVPGFDDALSRVLVVSMDVEPDKEVRDAMDDLLIELASPVGMRYLVNSSRSLRQTIALFKEVGQKLAGRLELHAKRLSELTAFIAAKENQPSPNYYKYLDELKQAAETSQSLAQYVREESRKGLSDWDIERRVHPKVSALVSDLERAIHEANQAFDASDSLLVKLGEILQRANVTLDNEIKSVLLIQQATDTVIQTKISGLEGTAVIEFTEEN